MADILETNCVVCGAPIRDYASNRRRSKDGKYCCSVRCRGLRQRRHESKAEKDAEYYRNNASHIRDRALGYYREHAVDIIERRRQKDRQLKREIVDAYGGKCECCEESTIEFLTIDHINGDGAEHRRKIGGKGRRIYAEIKREGFPKDRYRLLCLNCNISLGFYGYCPHHPEQRSGVSHVPFNPGRKRSVAP